MTLATHIAPVHCLPLLSHTPHTTHHLLQADCPEDVAAYIHRVGRTARYVSSGKGLVLLLPSERDAMLAQVGAEGLGRDDVAAWFRHCVCAAGHKRAIRRPRHGVADASGYWSLPASCNKVLLPLAPLATAVRVCSCCVLCLLCLQLEEAKVPMKQLKHNPAKVQPVTPALQALLSKDAELKVRGGGVRHAVLGCLAADSLLAACVGGQWPVGTHGAPSRAAAAGYPSALHPNCQQCFVGGTLLA